jgi:voltage-gated potassium channel
MTFRRRLYLILSPDERGGIIERIFEAILILTIIINIVAIVLDSIPHLHEQYEELFDNFEIYSLIFFTVRIHRQDLFHSGGSQICKPVNGRIKYRISPIAIIDLLAFLPFYLTFLSIDLRFLRIFRLMALFRMFKIARYLHALSIFRRVLKDRKEQLV